MKLDELTPDPENRRLRTPRNLAVLEASLRDVGAARSIVVDETGRVLAGNGVVQAATAVGLSRLLVVDADGSTVVAVRRSGLTDEQKRALAIADNRAAELAEWDWPQLGRDRDAGLALAPWFTDAELADGLGLAAKTGHTDPDAVPPARATDIKRGDVFELGTHRLACGDSTNADDVARLVGDARPLLMLTDPPYGVDYDPAWRAAADVNHNREKLGRVTNDTRADWRETWARVDVDVAYVWHDGLNAATVQASLEAVGLVLRSQLIWAKDRFALSRGDYHWQHEACLYAVRKGRPSGRTDDRTQSTLWSVAARDDDGHGHGTQKPVELFARAMRNHAPALVYDPFAGSGTTVIAAEMLGRSTLALEIEPSYCQAAIDRWESFTGERARKV